MSAKLRDQPGKRGPKEIATLEESIAYLRESCLAHRSQTKTTFRISDRISIEFLLKDYERLKKLLGE